MRYEQPEIEIEKFSILDEIMDGGTSAGLPPIIDEDNDNNVIIESIGEVLGNIFSE